jgi:hypothetical protein
LKKRRGARSPRLTLLRAERRCLLNGRSLEGPGGLC